MRTILRRARAPTEVILAVLIALLFSVTYATSDAVLADTKFAVTATSTNIERIDTNATYTVAKTDVLTTDASARKVEGVEGRVGLTAGWNIGGTEITSSASKSESGMVGDSSRNLAQTSHKASETTSPLIGHKDDDDIDAGTLATATASPRTDFRMLR